MAKRYRSPQQAALDYYAQREKETLWYILDYLKALECNLCQVAGVHYSIDQRRRIRYIREQITLVGDQILECIALGYN